jgi:hypothetical protein
MKSVWGYAHRHFRGHVSQVTFQSFEEIDARFQNEWTPIAKEARREQK